MNPSRYMLIDERFPYPVKRRSRGLKHEKGIEPAVTLLPPDPYLIMERPNFMRSSSPTIYKTVPPKSAKNKQASSFVILGETLRTPVQSRPGSPSGRVSPFRGHGFKSPNTTRPNSRIPSPSDSPKKPPLPAGQTAKPVKMTDRPRIGRDIGLPPKSPVSSKLLNSNDKPSQITATSVLETPKPTEQREREHEEVPQVKAEGQNDTENEVYKTASEDLTKPHLENKQHETDAEDKLDQSTNEKESPKAVEVIEIAKPQPKQSRPIQDPPVAAEKRQKLAPVTPSDKKPSVSPSAKMKNKLEGNEAVNQQSTIKNATKPPLPPKKIGLKTTLKMEDQSKKIVKEGTQGKSEINKKKEKEEKKKEAVEDVKNKGMAKKYSKPLKEKEKKENSGEIEKTEVKEAKTEESKVGKNLVEKKSEEVQKPKEEELDNGERNEKVSEKVPEKVVPCFQPDKCQIAPPTMASPTPIITPTISTPSTTADLSTSPMKNSQSIAAAPTTVTPSSLSSVSSTVVLTGNLARRELEGRNKSKESGASAVVAKETKDSEAPEKAAVQMVKAASKDSIKWSNRDSLSGEITSATKLIKAEPEMEVLSPNNLRESPPRIPPPNVAWDEGRLANGDVANKAETEGKMRRFISALWKFVCYLFCCRCFGRSKCCRRSSQDGMPKPSLLSRLNCCKGKSCGNPFACCTRCCKCKCEGKKCCRRNKKPGNSKPKSRKCCAKVNCSCKGCCDKVKAGCLNARYKMNSICRSLFCLNLMCCQNFLRKFKFCHKLKCCQKNGFCSCCNPNVKKETKKLNKKGSRASNNSRDKDNLDVVLVEHTSLMKAAIPVLPSCLAVFCLILNLFVPGFGTFISGILCLCFGKPRFSVKDTPKNRVGSFILNTIIGVAQLFTVVFCLVGWGWSVWWGVIMYKLSRRQKRLKLAEKNQKEAEGSNVNHNHVDVEQG